MDIYAIWGETYKITLDGNGGHFADGQTTNVESVNEGQGLYIDPQTQLICDKEGNYAFDGWYDNPECTGNPIDFSMNGGYYPTKDVTFYAKWSEAYKITYVGNGGQVGTSSYDSNTMSDTYVDYVVKGKYINRQPDTKYADDSKGFYGWSKNADGENIVYPEGITPESNMTFFAIWKPQYKVTFNGNGGYCINYGNKETVQSTYVVEGCTIPSYYQFENENAGKVFDGWYRTPNCTGDAVDLYNTYVTEDTILYAKWSDTYAVTFHTSVGTFYDTDTQESVQYVVQGRKNDNCPGIAYDDTHFALDGWSTDGSRDNMIDAYNFVPEGDVDLYAVWTSLNAVTFDANGGTLSYYGDGKRYTKGFRTDEMISDEATYISNGMSNEGKTFVGWALTQNATSEEVLNLETYIPENDVTLYAVWEDNNEAK